MALKLLTGNNAPFYTWPEVGYNEVMSVGSFEYFCSLYNASCPAKSAIRVIDVRYDLEQDQVMMVILWRKVSYWLLAFHQDECLRLLNKEIGCYGDDYTLEDKFEFPCRTIVGSYGVTFTEPKYTKNILDGVFNRLKERPSSNAFYRSNLANNFYHDLFLQIPTAEPTAEPANE